MIFREALFVVFVALATTSSNVANGQSVGDDLVFPEVHESVNGVLDVVLTLEYATHGNAIRTLSNTRLFNGTLPGPTLKVKAGDELRILFKNQLTEQPTQNTVENDYGYPDDTNLHFHGAHVSGELPSDDVTLSIKPGDEYQYVTHFPDNHMPGTHWIHPHVHGSGALQVGGGAAMSLIVMDDENDTTLPTEVKDALDVSLFVQHMNLSILNQARQTSGDQILSFSTVNDNGDQAFNLVNGQFQPRHYMQPGEWQRWRVAWASWLIDPLDLSISSGGNCEMQLLAKDGLYIEDYPRPINIAPIPTAGRADIMVRCFEAGDYTVEDFTGTLMHLRVEGETVSSSDLQPKDDFPTIPEYLQNMVTESVSNSECSCETAFEAGTAACNGDAFCVNGAAFEKSTFLHTIELGQVVERDLTGLGAHPYHQHVYPFQIVETPNIPQADDPDGDKAQFFQVGDWHDVLMIDGLRGSLLTRYKPTVHLGRIMLHCHRLNHEDKGMMAMEDVLDPADGGSCSCDAHHVRSTVPPTTSPTAAPSLRGSPTSGPTTAPTIADNCVDDRNWTATLNGNTFRCSQINSNNRNRRCNAVGTDGLSGNQACPVACEQSCDSAPTEAPNASPTAGPTRKETSPPTGAPNVAPTNSPTGAPNVAPTSSPTSSPSLRTAAPTANPTLRPTSSPTSVTPNPTTSPTPGSTTSCMDSTTWEAIRNNNVFGCGGINTNNQAGRCSAIGTDGLSGTEACPAACGVCVSTCSNDNTWLGTTVNNPTRERGCTFIANNSNPTNLCDTMSPVAPETRNAYEACPQACGIC